MSKLRGYQIRLKADVRAAWASGAKNVMMQSSTGSGKTVVIGNMAREHAVAPLDPRYPSGCAIAHRSELVGQISMQLAREDVPHDIIAPQNIIRGIVEEQIEELGRSFYNARAPWRVASVDTLNRRNNLSAWFPTVGFAVVDEAHHVLADNKWGKALDLFENALSLLPTATPIRADGRALGSHDGGYADALVEGPPMRELINDGYLTDYKIFCIQPKDLELGGVKIGASGDFNPEMLREAVHNSARIVGDVVETYCKHARGKLGVTFAVDVAHGKEITDAFIRAGVPAIFLSADNTAEERRAALRKFRNREVWQLVNVDLFGEGFDLPAIECVSFARPTASFALFSQQWGRALRLMISRILQAAWDSYTPSQRKGFIAQSGKPFAFIFDHVGNFYRHEGPPDRPMVWHLEGRNRRNTGGGIPYRVCLNVTCALPYERIYPACPYCGTEAPPPADRSGPEAVDGDITEIDPQLLARYRGEIARIDAPPVVPYGVPRTAVVANHMKRQSAQHYLREAIGYWAASYGDEPDRVNYRRFWFEFKIDVLAAQALNEKDANALREKIYASLAARGIVVPTVNNEMEYEQ